MYLGFNKTAGGGHLIPGRSGIEWIVYEVSQDDWWRYVQEQVANGVDPSTIVLPDCSKAYLKAVAEEKHKELLALWPIIFRAIDSGNSSLLEMTKEKFRTSLMEWARSNRG